MMEGLGDQGGESSDPRTNHLLLITYGEFLTSSMLDHTVFVIIIIMLKFPMLDHI